MTQRFQTDNDIGSGDIVNDPNNFAFILPSQSGMTTTQFKLPMSANSTDNYYTNWWIKVITGFSTNQVRQITNYIGSTRIATIDIAFDTQNPSLGDMINLYDRTYVGLIWSEANLRFEFGTTVQNPLGGPGVIPSISNTSMTAYDETSQCLPALRFLRQMVQIWLQDVHAYTNIFADMQLNHFYRWLQSTKSLLYEPALKRTIQVFMRKLL